MTFDEANRRVNDMGGFHKGLDAFGIDTLPPICDKCERERVCVARHFFHKTIIGCRFHKRVGHDKIVMDNFGIAGRRIDEED